MSTQHSPPGLGRSGERAARAGWQGRATTPGRTGLGEEVLGRLGLLACRNVAGNLRGPNDPASTIPDGRDGRRIQSGAILVQPLGLVMVDAFPTLQAFEKMGKIIDKSGGTRRVSGWPMTSSGCTHRAVAPRFQLVMIPSRGMANDRIIRGVDNRRQALPVSSPRLRSVMSRVKQRVWMNWPCSHSTFALIRTCLIVPSLQTRRAS